jgi:hypothetical protein
MQICKCKREKLENFVGEKYHDLECGYAFDAGKEVEDIMNEPCVCLDCECCKVTKMPTKEWAVGRLCYNCQRFINGIVPGGLGALL